MNPYDAIVLLILLLGVWRGWRSGIIRQAGGLLGVVLGGWLASSAGSTIARWVGIESWGTEVVFLVILLSVILVMLVLTYFVDKAFSGLGLGVPVRVLGVFFAVGKFFVVMSLLVACHGYAQNHWLSSWGDKSKKTEKTATTKEPTRFEQSHSYKAFSALNHFLFPGFE